MNQQIKKATIDQPLYRVGADRVLTDDVTQYGLHRKHVVRKGGMPDCESWMQTYPQATAIAFMHTDGTGHLWLFWKEKGKE